MAITKNNSADYLKSLGTTRQQSTLSNGGRLVVFERAGMPVFMRASFLSGSKYDPMGKEGTSHFLEHMLVAGSKKFSTKDKLAAYIEQFGGELGAFTGSDYLMVNVTVGDPLDIEAMIEVLHEMLLEPLFDDQTIEKERQSILKELGDRKSNPSQELWEVWRKLFFQNTQVGRSTLGSEESIKAISKQDLVDFYNRNITAGRSLLIAAGGVDLDRLTQQAETSLQLKPSEKFKPEDDLPIYRDHSVAVEKFDGKDQVHLIFGFRAPRLFHQDNPALNIISEVLGGGRASTLTKKLRYERGLIYTLSAWNYEYSDTGSWFIKTSTSKDKLQELIDVVSEEIRRVIDTGLTDSEINFAKDKLIKSRRNKMQTSFSWVDFHAHSQLLSDKPWTVADYVEEIRSVTREQIQKAAQTYFGGDKWYLAMCGDVTEEAVKVNL